MYGSGSPWPVLLVLSSFVLAWLEAWFLDFRVVPIERQAAIYLSRKFLFFYSNLMSKEIFPCFDIFRKAWKYLFALSSHILRKVERIDVERRRGSYFESQ